MENKVEAVCRSIYRDSKDFYQRIANQCENLGFQILYGPPFANTPILFIGYQPGTGSKSPEEERLYGSEDRWPSVCEYATEDWPLAKNLRRMFGRELLKQCVGLNAIFMRSPNAEHFRKRVERKTRQEIKQFCLPLVGKIVETLRPKTIVVIGFETLSLFGESSPILRSERKNRVLAKAGKVAGREAIGTLHLSGAHIHRSDCAAIATHVLAALNSH
jgi:hypothetical protein